MLGKKSQNFRIKIERVKFFSKSRNAKNHDRGGFQFIKLHSTNFKYMILMWNFFGKIPSAIFIFPSV